MYTAFIASFLAVSSFIATTLLQFNYSFHRHLTVSKNDTSHWACHKCDR